ncbi:cyclophilin-like fold protein [Tenacibaculum sp. 47A_GOM-205m]|uniref:cyclophilin-like fold protein n=1 Tax=Tenacibaculum sp. 47A_GOM-205m TaxID=1380384 RepID=UPI0018CC512D|nr:cyclophilin-like fold protein [Tenacibaculum sp. 47A_GOM-205m]
MKKLIYTIIILLGCTQLYACNKDKELDKPKQESMKLKITIGENTATAIMYDNPTSRDFTTMLPLTVEMDDYANTEKIFYPSKKLSTEDAPKGFKPSEGDITLYAPWGNIALFYKDFSYSNGLISLGKVTNGIKYFKTNGKITVTIELEQ